jgi:hypothetical protein
LRDLLDTICEKAQIVRAIGDLLSTVDPHELEADTVRTLGLLLLREGDILLGAAKRPRAGSQRQGHAMKSGTSGTKWDTSGTVPLSRG